MYDHFKREANRLKCDYWEIRIEKTNSTSFDLENGEFEIHKNYYEGLGIRVLNKGSWGFASVNQIDKSSFDEALKHALRLSKIKSRDKKEVYKYKKQKYKEKQNNKNIDINKWTKKL